MRVRRLRLHRWQGGFATHRPVLPAIDTERHMLSVVSNPATFSRIPRPGRPARQIRLSL